MSADGGKPSKKRRSSEPPLELLRFVAGQCRVRTVTQDEYRLMMDHIDFTQRMMAELDSQDASIERMKRLKFSPDESTRHVLGEKFSDKTTKDDAANGSAPKDGAGAPSAEATGEAGACGTESQGNDGASGPCSTKRKRRPPCNGGHGRRRADSYTVDETVELRHPRLKPGDRCSACGKGTLRAWRRVRVHIRAHAPMTATKYVIYELRCRLCGKIHPFPLPLEARRKYHESVAATIAYNTYRVGTPIHTSKQVQELAGVPMPVGTQYELAATNEPLVRPVVDELIRQAANAPRLYNDDTPNKILDITQDQRKEILGPAAGDRTGIFTTAIVAETTDDRRITLYFTGPRHAGENLRIVLKYRAAGLPPPQLMCDALPHNVPKEFELIVCNCCAHGRRQFVDVYKKFEDEVRVVLYFFSHIYAVEDEARRLNLSPEQRLQLHRKKSRPIMIQMALWMRDLLRDRKVEPNSGLGKAIRYIRRHWTKLTRFYRVCGARLDNNITERAIKTVIRHRKNSLFYRTVKSAGIGDTYSTLIVTAERSGIDAIKYLTTLMQNPDSVASDPAAWLPWTYRQTLERREQAAQRADAARLAGRCSTPSA
jgi:transposase